MPAALDHTGKTSKDYRGIGVRIKSRQILRLPKQAELHVVL